MIEQLYMTCFVLTKLIMPLAIIVSVGGLAYIFASTYHKTRSFAKAFKAILP